MTYTTDKKEYDSMTDEQLASLAQQGDREAERLLVVRFMPLIRIKIRPYFLIGADSADLAQEGAIGLCNAIRDFDGGRNVSFRAYAEVCIMNNVIAAIKRATRKKHIPLNNYVSLDMPLSEDDDGSETLADRLDFAACANPEELAISREEERALVKAIGERLTDFEKRVLSLYLEGKSYKLIAEELERTPKSADNALQRIKKKIAALIAEE